MARTVITSPEIAWGPIPISQAVRSGNLVFVSGIPGFTRDFQLAKGDFAAQMKQAMENVGAILRAAGTSFDRVVKCTVLLARQEDWAAMKMPAASSWWLPSSAMMPAPVRLQSLQRISSSRGGPL